MLSHSRLGHVNHDTVDYAAERLPSLVRTPLETVLQQAYPASPRPERISEILSQAIVSVDAVITSEFLSMFPREGMSVRSDVMKTYINDASSGGARHVRVSRMLGGTTALLTLFHEASGNLWVANLGDCCAGLCVIYLSISEARDSDADVLRSSRCADGVQVERSAHQLHSQRRQRVGARPHHG